MTTLVIDELDYQTRIEPFSSTQVPVCALNIVEGQLRSSFESRNMTYTALVRRKKHTQIQTNKKQANQKVKLKFVLV
jgi:hypothetical protein